MTVLLVTNPTKDSGYAVTGQAAALLPLARAIKERGLSLWMYTGYTFEQLLHGTLAQQALLRELDVLVDGPFLLEQRSLDLLFRGSGNQRILNVPQSLQAGSAVWETRERWVGES